MQAFVATKEREEHNKRVAACFIEGMSNHRKPDLAVALISSNNPPIAYEREGAGGLPRSPESVRREAAAWLAEFPDLSIHQIATGRNNDVVEYATNLTIGGRRDRQPSCEQRRTQTAIMAVARHRPLIRNSPANIAAA